MAKKHPLALEEDEEQNRTLLPRKKKNPSKLPLILGRTLKLRRSWLRHLLFQRHQKANRAKTKVLTYGRDWFDKSFLVQAIASFGVDENTVKQRWSMAPMENKKRLEEKWRVLQAKELEFMLLKTSLLHEMTSAMIEASN